MNKRIDLVVPDECFSMVDCWEAIITIMLVYFNKDKNAIYSASDFYYDILKPNDQKVTLEEMFRRTISLYNKEIIENILSFYEQFFHFKISIIDKKSITEMQKTIEKELSSNTPIVVFIDTYYCKFNRMYNKFHYFHAVLINGIDGNQLLVYDPTQHLDSLEVDIQDIYFCAEALLKFENDDVAKMPDSKSLLKYNFVRNNFRSIHRKSTRMENIEQFLKDIINNKSEIYRSFERSEESLNIMFSWLLKNTAVNIRNHSDFIEKTYSEEASCLLSMLKDSQTKWMLAGRIFMKMYYVNHRMRDELFDRLCGLINEILVLERAIFNEFASLLELEHMESEEVYYG